LNSFPKFFRWYAVISEVVKVDAKGRITIPAYVRLLLNIDNGGRVLMNVDEDKGVIMLKVFQENWTRCWGVLTKRELVKLFNEAKVIASRCFVLEGKHDEYRCDMVIEGKEVLGEVLGKLNCFSD
jgi:AbrB family looped-hinge helix DNA binding protein